MFSPLQFTISILAFALLLIPAARSECIDPHDPQTRVFDSIDDFQGNKIAFDPENKTSKGNYVAFSNFSINTIQRNTFVTYDSQHIRTLSLDNHQIHEIDQGAFITLRCVSVLTMRNNAIVELAKNMFIGLVRLHELDLGENTIREIPEHVFDLTRGLKKLNLTRNSIRIVHADSFYNLTLLEELDLSYNYLKRVSPYMFQYLYNLVNLQLGSNDLVLLDADRWSNLTKLKVLNFSDNELVSFDLSSEFSFHALEQFYLDDNNLTKLNPHGLMRNFPKLKVFDLSENPWTCEDLIPITRVLNDSKISYRGPEISEPNIAGISCNRSFDTYQRKKWVNPIDIHEVTTVAPAKPSNHSSNSEADVEKSSLKSVYLSNVEILDSVKSLRTIIVCLLVLVIVFVVVDVAVRTGCLGNFIARRRRGEMMDNADVENFSLLRDRF